MGSFPTAGVGSVVHLVGSLAIAAVRGRERVAVLDRWVRRHSAGQEALVVNVLLTRWLLVTGAGLSARVLADPPGPETFTVGTHKRKGMGYLAPRALTISDGEEWVDRRGLNEAVLCTGRAHDLRDTMLNRVNDAFAAPLETTNDVRDRMARVMTDVVVGGSAPSDLPDEVDALIGVAQSPPRRIALGWWHRRRRRRLYRVLRRRLADAPDDTLVGRARRLGDTSSETAEQIPHWMFTFTGSATDLLSHTLAIVASRPAVRDAIAAEIAPDGVLDEARRIDTLAYSEACLRETGRLFPPVTSTFHCAPHGGEYDGREIPTGIQLVHYFPLLSRDGGDPTTHDFRPERWLDGQAPPSNLFLSGARSCPGEDLILFICKAALAQVGRGLATGAPELAHDPLPRTFPVTSVRLTR